MEIVFGPIQICFAFLFGIIFIVSLYNTAIEYIRKRHALSNYVYKIVKEISTNREYVAIGYSLNFVDEEIVYITDVKNVHLEVHPNQIMITKKVFLLGKPRDIK